ncbi:MAG: chemotaxis protein chel [Rhodobacter sp. CACIA14H1]|nr:MAG: chemotaxis protein chel [Rhodobacter sp. CACIA14H1]
MLLPPSPPSAGTGPLWRKAQELEASFLAEMLRHSGSGPLEGPGGGGIGEEQFGSFLREAQAEAMVKAGGIGLAEHIFRSLEQRART